jgi:hypothetical protein
MKPAIALLAFLVLAPAAWADPPDLKIDAEVRPSGQYVRMVPKTDAVAITYVGLDSLDPIPSDLLRDSKLFLLDTRGLKEGKYRFVAVAAGKTGEQARADFAVIIGTPGPTPGPGPDPGPGPGPDPDPFAKKADPFVNGSRAPPGFRVLMVYDADHLRDYPSAQRTALNSDLVRGYFRSHCIKGPDGTPDWRCFDQGADMSEEDPMWKKVMSRPRKSLPWICIGTGTRGYEGPLPKDTDAVLELLAKYGGK